ncbi:Cupredoxin [Chlamydoabsidia padenii]|nr:Cupredoxin [Chlamydoabsidia padenii]
MRLFPLVATLISLTSHALGELQRYEFTIGPSFLDPDCSGASYAALTINGQFPGPTIYAEENDELEIIADQGTSIHFHGIRQYGSVESDGVPDVTQNAIPPGGSFTHRFKLLDQSGTYFYHAHVGVQDDTVQGAIIIGSALNKKKQDEEEEEDEDEDEEVAESVSPPCTYHDGPYSYHGEFVVHMTEWWHSSWKDREHFILSPEFTHDSDADSLLINGRTVHDASSQCAGHTVFDVLPNRVYRMRVIGGMTFRTFGLGIAGHDMTIIEVDGVLVQPYRTSALEVGPGQRFSVLIHTTASQESDEFVIATNYLYRKHKEGTYSNGIAYLRYLDPAKLLNKRQQSDMTTTRPTLFTNTTSDKVKYASYPHLPKHNPPNWIWPKLKPLIPAPSEIIDGPPDRTLKIRPKATSLPDGSQRYMINGNLSPMIINMADTAAVMRATDDDEDHPMLQQYTLAQAQTLQPDRPPVQLDGFEPLLGTYPIQYHEVIDIVLQNVQTGPLCIHHPWHTHGHSHYLIASGPGEYVHARDHDKRNFPHPIYKDVSPVYATPINPHTKGCGWTKIRIYADNPGVWAVHCHITAHMLQGMFFVLEEAPERIQEHKLYK